MSFLGKRESDLPEGRELAEAADDFLRAKREPVSFEFLETCQAEFLRGYFRGVPEEATRAAIDLRVFARNFRDFYVACRNDPTQLSQILQIDKKAAEKLISHLTLTGFADFAKGKFETAARRSGTTSPGSFEERDWRRNADYWGYVEQIVREASEMKD